MPRVNLRVLTPPSDEVPTGRYLDEDVWFREEQWGEVHKLTTKYLEDLRGLSTKVK